MFGHLSNFLAAKLHAFCQESSARLEVSSIVLLQGLILQLFMAAFFDFVMLKLHLGKDGSSKLDW